jgi:transposase
MDVEVVHPLCCGLDVHKKSLTACLLRSGASGQALKEVRTFGTCTAELRRLADWLAAAGCQHVALESTGVYWKPVYNVLEQSCQEVLLINPQHVKALAGRKTDRLDAARLAGLLRLGELSGSFIPPKPIRELRELTRHRATLVRQRADECNRIQKLLENGNVKLASVASDVLGKSGRAMLAALAAGQDDPEVLAQMARGRLRQRIPQLVEALEGHLGATDRWLLGEHLGRVAELDAAIERVDEKVAEQSRPYEDELRRLDAIPGVNRRIAEVIVAEVGVDMERFGSDARLAAWAGMSPGNRETAGKRQSGRRGPGDVWLQAALVEAGWAAGHASKRKTRLYAQYRRLARRRGKKRACVAVGHSILRIAYRLLAGGQEYQDLGEDYYDRHDRERRKEGLLRQLRELGLEVTVKDAVA